MTTDTKQAETGKRTYLPHLQVLLAGGLWGGIGLWSRNLVAGGLTPYSIVLLRNLGGLILLATLFLCIDQRVFRIRIRHLPYFFGTGIVSVLLFTICYFSCQQLVSLAVSAILLYTAPTFVVILSALLWKDKLTKGKCVALGLAFLGCTFVSGVWGGSLNVTPRGFLLGLGAGFFYALYSIFGRYALRYYSPFTVTFYTFLFAGVGALCVANPLHVVATISSPPMVFFALGMVVFSTVLPYLLYTKGLSKLDSGKASILASTEPVVAALVGVLAFGEPMGLSILLGLACILVSIYILR